MKIPDTITDLLKPLFEVLPPERALSQLVVERGASKEVARLAEGLLRKAEFAGNPGLAAGLWLYVDELERSHEISQGMRNATGSFWHGIMHRREGDFSNSHYWFNCTGAHPAMAQIPGYDPHEFIDRVAKARGKADEELAALQRLEWRALFEHCAAGIG